MQRITQDQSNDLIFYIKSELADPYYLVYFENRSTGATKTCICENQNDNEDCPVLLTIIEVGEGGTEDLANAEIRLTPCNSWGIKVYDQASSTNLNINLSNQLLASDFLDIIEQ